MQQVFELKSSFVFITGDCRNSNWYLGDSVTPHRVCVEALTTFYGFYQLCETPTLLLQN